MEGTTERELEKIQGVVDTLIYKNDDSGWAVARVDLGVGEELVITGVMPYLGGRGEHRRLWQLCDPSGIRSSVFRFFL